MYDKEDITSTYVLNVLIGRTTQTKTTRDELAKLVGIKDTMTTSEILTSIYKTYNFPKVSIVVGKTDSKTAIATLKAIKAVDENIDTSKTLTLGDVKEIVAAVEASKGVTIKY